MGLFNLESEAHISQCRKNVFAFIAIFVVVLAGYSNTFDASWHLDDDPNILHREEIHLSEFTWPQIKKTFFHTEGDLYRPASCLSLAINYYFGQDNVFGYHVVNLLIHFLASMFLFLFICHTLNLPLLKARYGRNSYSIALLAAVLWAINPIQTQAVTYIVQRMASMAGMFYVISMYLYVKARTAEMKSRKVLFLVSCIVSIFLALCSKENAAMLPLSILLYEILLVHGIRGHYLRKNMRLLFIVSGAILLLGLTYIYTQGGNFSFLEGYGHRPFTLAQRLLTEPRIIIFYISLLLYPVPNRLSLAHPIEPSTSLLDPPSTIIALFLILGAIFLAAWLSKKRPLIAFCIFFYFLNHVIESTIFPLELIFEHRNYTPSLLFFVPISIGFYHLFNYFAVRRRMQYILSGFIVLFLVELGHSTYIRNFTWKNEESLWIDAVEKAPEQFRPHHNLGKYYHLNGFRDKAMAEYQTALTKPATINKSEQFITYYNLGNLYSESGDYEKAIWHYGEAIKKRPDFTDSYNNLAIIMDKEEKYDLAYEYLLKAIELNPTLAHSNNNLGIFYLQDRKPDRAIFHFQIALKDRGFKKNVLQNLGIAYKQKGEFGRAVTYFRKALKQNPLNLMTRLHLAEMFFRTGNIKQSQQEINEVIRLLPDKDRFDNALSALFPKNRSRNITPTPHIIVQLIAEACEDRSKNLIEWSGYALKRLGEMQGERLEKPENP